MNKIKNGAYSCKYVLLGKHEFVWSFETFGRSESNEVTKVSQLKRFEAKPGQGGRVHLALAPRMNVFCFGRTREEALASTTDFLNHKKFKGFTVGVYKQEVIRADTCEHGKPAFRLAVWLDCCIFKKRVVKTRYTGE